MTAPTPRRWTGADVTRAVWQHFAAQSWAGLTEVTAAGSQWANWQPGDPFPTGEEGKDRRIDLLLLRTPRKEGLGNLERLAVEVKISRADFLSDVKNPAKQAPWREIAHRHAYAVPEGLVQPSEVPAGSGLIYVSELSTSWGGENHTTTVVRWASNAPYTATNPEIPGWMPAYLARRASWSEGKTKGWLAGVDEDDVEKMRRELDQLRRDNSSLTNKLTTAVMHRDEWRRLAGMTTAAASIPCKWCGQTIVSHNITMRWGVGWKHADKAHDEACQLLMVDRYSRIAPADDFDPATLTAVTA